jgi:O-antigen ligase
LILGAVGVAALALVLVRGLKESWISSKFALLLSTLFFFFSTVSVISSNLPFTQNLYGVVGRNTGYLTYLFLLGVMLGATLLRNRVTLKWLFLGLFVTGVVNVLYCAWAIFFGDFIGWNNPYGNILGLFGNPNFIGAFLGIWISSTVGYFLGLKLKLWQYGLVAILLVLALYEVYKSHAVQGVVVSAAGLATVGFYFIRSRSKGLLAISIYSIPVIAFGITGLFGAFQKGPLAEIVYKTSVSLRGVYWRTGIETGLQNPLFGAGMDGYGDWYRRSRGETAATVFPGPQTITNSAHNVVLDIFSYGGFPLLISYLGIMLLGVVVIIRNLRRTRNYDPVFVALSVAWIGYQLQSIISINQIGLAVWGWVLTGALVAYDRIQKREIEGKESISSSSNNKLVKQNSSSVFSSPLIAGIGGVMGLILAAPPMAGDMAWVKATRSQSLQEVEKALVPTYLHPSTSERYANAVELLHGSKLYDLSHKYALLGVKFNSENFGAWFALYSVAESTKEEKALALKNMQRLDPFNPELPSQ